MEDIDIVFTGIRPGEKLFEELETIEEKIIKTRHPKIFIGRLTAYPEPKILHALDRLATLAASGWDREIRKVLSDLLPEAQLNGLGTTQSSFENLSQLVAGDLVRSHSA